jgi:hypothetical protein
MSEASVSLNNPLKKLMITSKITLAHHIIDNANFIESAVQTNYIDWIRRYVLGCI